MCNCNCNCQCNTSYINNKIFGTSHRPVIFTTMTTTTINNEEVAVMTSEFPFFDALQLNYDDDYRCFMAVFAFSAPFGNTDSVYMQDGPDGTMIPLRSAKGGFAIQLDQIQSLCNARKLVYLCGCYDGSNDHINILTPVAAKHKTTTPTATPKPSAPTEN